MFGRKIPDKVMGSMPSPGDEKSQQAKGKPPAERSLTPARGESPPRRSNTGAVGTVLGEDTVFQGGKITSKGTLRIDGSVEGEIVVQDSVVVGATGVVKADIKARSVAVSGKVFGNIVASERLELQPTSEVHGDITTAAGALIIEGGAKLEGKCIMGGAEERPPAVRREAPPQAKRAESPPPPKQKG